MFNWLWLWIEKKREHELEIIRLNNEHQLEIRVCQACETLKTQLEAQNLLIRELTRNKTESEPVKDYSQNKPIMPRHKPWSIVQQELQRADRELAAKLREEASKVPITENDIEKELEEMQNAK